MFRVQVAGQDKLGTLARDLKRAGGQLRPELTASLRKPTKALYQAVEREVLTGDMSARPVPGADRRVPAGLGRGNHVRRPVLRGLEWKVTTAAGNPRAELTWRPSKVSPRVRQLLAYLTGQKDRLRHPIFGKAADGSWRGGVSQKMPNAWAKAKNLGRDAQKAVAGVLDHTAAIIAGRK